ncbi:MAG: adenylate/guanylate cyclase domain-containing protein [Myxococcaceae bacterium]
MLALLKTVRRKLLALVFLSAGVMVIALPLLGYQGRKQLLSDAADRVDASESSFEAELLDDVTALRLSAQVIAADEATANAIHSGDAKAALSEAQRFAAAWPHLDVLMFDAEGKLVAQVGCDHPRSGLGTLPAGGAEQEGVVEDGCEADPSAPPAYLITVPVPGGGTVVACLPFDPTYLDNPSKKLSLELLIRDGAGKVIARTPHFPETGGQKGGVLQQAGQVWALGEFSPSAMKGMTVEAARESSDLEAVVRRNLLHTLLALGGATALALIAGWRLASVMSRALGRISAALEKLKQQEYVHVDTLRTGDELEDLADGFNSMVDGLKERDKLRNTFGKYMTQSVMEHLLAGKVQLGGEELEVTILFSDLRGFTTISEKMDAKSLVGLLNEYFTEMVAAVMGEGGVVDKYIGDAIMAVFGAPVPKPQDPVSAVRAAVKMRDALVHLNARLKARGLPELQAGIGIHTGVVVAGNIGSEQRMEYTVIGDAVNLASRLESATKELQAPILISDETYKKVQGHVKVREVKQIQVKGRAAPVTPHEVLGLESK